MRSDVWIGWVSGGGITVKEGILGEAPSLLDCREVGMAERGAVDPSSPLLRTAHAYRCRHLRTISTRRAVRTVARAMGRKGSEPGPR